MKLNRFALILTIMVIAFSCKKKDEVTYGPCGEEPIGIEPLNFYSIQFGVGIEGLSDAIGLIWHKDSVRIYDEFENETTLTWGVDGSGSDLTDPIYFFDYSEDSLSFNSFVTNVYYIDFHETNYIDRDTLEIQFKVEDVECGQILNPLQFNFNNSEVDDYGFIQTRILPLIKS